MASGVVQRRLPPLPQISDIIQLFNLQAKSQLSQNFILDLNVTDRLVRVAGKIHDCCVCEVGPGPGALTRSILNAGAKRVVAVERDARFLPSLELLSDASNNRLVVHHGDALEFDVARNCCNSVNTKKWEEDPPNLHIIGNLPFNVSIPLLIQWLSMIPARQGPFTFGRSQMTLTFQKEVAERLVAQPSDHQRSRPSIMAQNFCHVKWGFVIPSKCFVPQPKIQAVVVKLTPLVTPVVDVDFDTFELVVRILFRYRRKFVSKAAMLLFPDYKADEQRQLAAELLEAADVRPTQRVQEMSVQQFGTVANWYRDFLSANSRTISDIKGYDHSLHKISKTR